MRCLLPLCVLFAHAEEDDHEGHDHGDHGDGAVPYEWAGIFETKGDDFVWLAQKVNGEYVDPGMKLAALPADKASKKELDALATEGEHALEETCTEIHPGGTVKIVPQAHACYQLMFDDEMPDSMFKIDGSGAKAIAFFAEHVPTEFERDLHYLKNATGGDVEPVAELPEAEEAAETDWGGPIVASLIVNIVTFAGVVFTIPVFKRLSETYSNDFQSTMSAFACGAILSCAFYLLLFEATHLIAVGWTEEVDVLWRWGTAILAGFSLPVLTQTVASALASEQAGKSTTDEKAKSVVVSRSRIMSGVLIGDFFHNICDGFFMGAAFKGCGADFGWKVLIGTAAHELAQELADYLVLTGPDAQLRPITALAMNFVSGMGVLLGTVIILASEIGQDTIGILLAFGGGVYLHVAATECMPRVYSETLSLNSRILCLVAFFVGAIGIGLVLLDHEHCVPEGHAHGH